MPRTLIVAAALLACGCNEIRYQAARLRKAAPPLEVPHVAELPDHRVTYECKSGEPFDIYFPPGGVGAALTLVGEALAGDGLNLMQSKIFAAERYHGDFSARREQRIEGLSVLAVVSHAMVGEGRDLGNLKRGRVRAQSRGLVADLVATAGEQRRGED